MRNFINLVGISTENCSECSARSLKWQSIKAFSDYEVAVNHFLSILPHDFFRPDKSLVDQDLMTADPDDVHIKRTFKGNTYEIWSVELNRQHDDCCADCGAAPGDGITKGCNDPSGCGFWRDEQIRQAGEFERSG